MAAHAYGMPTSATVVIVVFDGVQSLDVAGPAEVFAAAGHRVHIISRDGDPVRTTAGFTIAPHGDLRSVPARSIDTLVVAGGTGTPAAVGDPALIGWLRKTTPRVRRVASVCSGAFLLAEAGVLDGRRATTHWSVCDTLARRHPRVTVDPDPIFVRDGNVWTSAGVTAGMDLALALVEDDHGRDAALEIARRFVLFLRRPANQSQFSSHLAVQTADRDVLRELQAVIADDPGADLSVATMAARVHMSERHFARSFRDATGVTPARYVEAVRVEAARRRLEESDDGVDAIARQCGFGTAETMRRSFLRVVRVAPAEYRRRFRSVAS